MTNNHKNQIFFTAFWAHGLAANQAHRMTKIIKKLGIDYKKKGGLYEIYGYGLNGFNPKDNTIPPKKPGNPDL